MLVQFKRAYFWWETQKTYKLGEIIDVDLDQYKELISKGVANAYTEPPETEKEVLEGTNWVCFKKSINGFKCGDIVEIDAKEARVYKEKGIAVAATIKPMVIEEVIYPEGKQIVQFLKSTEEYKMNDIVELDNKIAIPLIENGIAVYWHPVEEEKIEYPEGKQIVQFLKSTEDHKSGDIINLDNKIAFPLIEKGIAVYWYPVEEKKIEYPEGTTTIQFIKTTEGHKCGDIIEFDNKIAIPLIEKGIAVVATVKPMVLKEEPEGKQTIQFIRTTENHKCGDIDTIDASAAALLIRKGIAISYSPIEKEEVIYSEGSTLIQFIRTTEDYKSGDIMTFDNKIALPLIEKGIAVAAKEENETKKLLKSISKMNRDDLLEFAKEKEIDTFGYKHEDLIRQSIKIALMR